MPARIVIRDRGAGLTADDRTVIETAFTDALRMAERVVTEMNGVWNQPGRIRRRRRRRRNAWSAHGNFTTWFGTSRRHILIRRVRRRINRLGRWLDRGRIIVIAHSGDDFACRGNTAARSRIPRRPLKVHLCPAWFLESQSQRAAIIIHELVHELGFMHPEGATTMDTALALAVSNSRKARRSPENFRQLYILYFPG